MPFSKQRALARNLSSLKATALAALIAVGRKADEILFRQMARNGLVLGVVPPMHRLMEGADDGKGGGGGSGDDVTKHPGFAAALSKAIEAEVTGLKTKNGELIASQKQLKEQLAKFEGIDPEAVRAIMKRFADDEEAGLLKAGKLDEVIEKRTGKMRESFEKQLKDATSALEAANKRAQAFQGRVLDDAVRAAATKAGLHQHAIDDALFRARSMFSLDEHGQAVQVGEDGKPVLGKDGKSPFTPLEWLEGMKDKAPHWFPASASGGGAGGSGKTSDGKKTMTRAAFQALDPAAQAKAAQEYTFVD
jgi:hypothetical protein